MLGFFIRILKFVFPKLFGFVGKVANLTKVHVLPLLGGTAMGLAFLSLYNAKIIHLDLSFLLNQTLLDSLCAAYAVCGLTIADGEPAISSALVAIGMAYLFESFYRAKCPNSKKLQELEAHAEEVFGATIDDKTPVEK